MADIKKVKPVQLTEEQLKAVVRDATMTILKEELEEGVWNRFTRGVKDAWSGYRQGYAMQRRIEHIRKLIPEVEKNVDQMSSLINELPSDDYTTAMQKYISSIQYSIKGLNDMCAHLQGSQLQYKNPQGQYRAQSYNDYMRQQYPPFADTARMYPESGEEEYRPTGTF